MVRVIQNVICGAEGCQQLSAERLETNLGFIAGFCHPCALALSEKGLVFLPNEGRKKRDDGVAGNSATKNGVDSLHGILSGT